MRRVVVTGIGLITPLGNDTASTWDGLVAGRSGIGYVTNFDASMYEFPIAGEVRGFEPERFVDAKLLRRIDRSSALALAATRLAVDDSQLDVSSLPPDSIGCVLGTGMGGAHLLIENQRLFDEKGPRRVSPFMVTSMLPDTATGLVAITLGVRGPNFAITAACATGGAALGECAEVIARGDADVMIGGGFEALRARLHAGESLAALVAASGTRLITSGLQPWSRWVTPVGLPKRFDTLFFVARTPVGQTPEVDAGETTTLAWVNPPAALEMREKGEFPMEFATISTVESLRPFATTQALLDHAAAQTRLPAIHPRMKVDAEGRVRGVVLPGQPGYEQAHHAD